MSSPNPYAVPSSIPPNELPRSDRILRLIDWISISFAAAPLLFLGGLYVFIGDADNVSDDSTLMTILALLFLVILVGFLVGLLYNLMRLLLGGSLGIVGLFANGVTIVVWALEFR